MGFVIEDVDLYIGGLSAAQKRRWLAAANAALQRCHAEGSDELECEVSAVKVANTKIEGGEETEVSAESLKRFSDRQRKVVEQGLDVSLLEASGEAEWQLVFPIGRHFLSTYGEMIFTRRFMEKLVEHHEGKVMNSREPFIDTNHDFGAANGWIKGMRVGERGVEVKIEWTPRGVKLLADREYRYFSATIMSHLDIRSGERFYPVMPAVTLTNIPAMNQMPGAHLEDRTGRRGEETEKSTVSSKQYQISTIDLSLQTSDNMTSSSAHGDGNHSTEESAMTFAEILAAIGSLAEEERGVVAKELGFTALQKAAKDLEGQVFTLSARVAELEGEAVILKKVNEDMTVELTEVKRREHETKKSSVIGAALSEMRIKPADKEFWEKSFDENPAFTEGVIARLTKVIPESKGTEANANFDEVTEESDVEAIVRKNLEERFGAEAVNELYSANKKA